MPSNSLKILAFDTSTEACSAAVLLDDHVIEREIQAANRHSELILQLVDELLNEARIRLSELSAIAFGAGPGSFTGLRIGCGVAQGLAFGAGLPVVGVSTLRALAMRASGENIIAALDARMGEIYHAAYRREGDRLLEVSAPALCKPGLAPELPRGNWAGCGSGWEAYSAALLERYPECGIETGLQPRAREMARLAAIEFAQGGGVDPAAAAPVYLRDKVALKESER